MKPTNIPRVLAAIAATWAIGQANAGIFDSIDKFVGSKGSAMEIVYGHAGQQGLPSSSYGITLEKKSLTELTVRGFYKGNFDVDASYVLGTGSIKVGPYAARELKPDGSPADYAGKILTVKRVIGINTSIGALYFDIPDTLGMRQGLELLMSTNATYEVNRFGGHDYSFRSMVIDGKWLEILNEIINSLKPSDNSSLTDKIKNAVIDAIAKNSEFRVGAMQLVVSDDEAGTNSRTVATMEQYTLSAFESNYTARDEFHYGGLIGSDKMVSREYPVQFVMDEANNSFTLLNFANKGYAISDEVKTIEVENTDTAGNVTTSTKRVIDTEFSPIRGTMDLENGTFTLQDRQQMEVDISGYNNWTSWIGDLFIGQGLLYRYGSFGLVPGPNIAHPQVTGTITTTEGEMHHKGSNLWHGNVAGGEMSTVVGSTREFIFDDYCTLWKRGTDMLDKDHYTYAKNLRVTVDGGERDATHDVIYVAHSLATPAMGPGFGVNADAAWSDRLQVFGALYQVQNSDAVDHYELYLHHTEVNRIDDRKFIGNYDSEKGLTNTTYVGKIEKSAARSNDVAIDFDFYLPKDEITNNNSKPLWGSKPAVDLKNDKFSVYVKTVYNNGLAPTFHALRTMQNLNVSTGINGIGTDENGFWAIGQQGSIAVSGNADVEIYDMQGRSIYFGQPATVQASAGIYIVRCGKASVKVVVK